MFIKKEKELREYIDKCTCIINVKEGKFFRDKPAHENGYAYKWNKKAYSRQVNRPTTHTVPKEIMIYLTCLLLLPYHLVNRQFITTYQRTDPKKGRENPMARPRNHFDAFLGLL